MSDSPIDFSSLDPMRDPRRFDDIVRTVAADGMAARRMRRELFAELAAWSRPAFAIAALIALIAIPTLARFRLAPPLTSPTSPVSTNVLGIPDQLVRLMRSSTEPSVTELAEAFNATGAGNGR